MKVGNEFEYDVCLSFAGEQRDYVIAVYDHLKKMEIKAFYDDDFEDILWGTNLIDIFFNIYKKKARYCVMFISQEYKEKAWTNYERQSALDRSFSSEMPYILPVRFDDTEIAGVFSSTMYLDGNKLSPQEIANKIRNKLQITSSKIENFEETFEVATYLIEELRELTLKKLSSVKWQLNENSLIILAYTLTDQKENILALIEISKSGQVIFENINLVRNSPEKRTIDKDSLLQLIAEDLKIY